MPSVSLLPVRDREQTQNNQSVLTELIRLRKSGASASAPSAPYSGETWFDTSADVLKYYDNSKTARTLSIATGTVSSLTEGTGIDLTPNTITTTGSIAVDTTVVATTNNSLTLTNKTISGSSNTLSDIANASLTNSSVTIGSTSVALGATAATVAGLTLTTPTIASLTNAQHNHTNAAGGGQITDAALSAAVGIAKGGTGQTTAAAGYAALSPLTTKGDVQTYSTTTARLAVGADGQVLSADSSTATGLKWIAAGGTGTVTSVATGQGLTGGTITTTGTLLVADGVAVNRAETETTAVATGTTVIPQDDTIPQNTEGDEYMTCAITPKATTNILQIMVTAHISNSAANPLTAALFQDSTANALAAWSQFQGTATGINQVTGIYKMVAGTTSSTTFKVRCGSPGAGTTTFNGASGTRRYGAISKSSIHIKEFKSA